MNVCKHCAVLLIMALVAAFIAVPAAQGQSRGEMSIEESYLQEAIELMIIRETARSDSRDQKLLALEYIGSALERGSTNEELRTTLEYLSLEGTLNRTRQGGREINNYPDVRRQAVRHLGSISTNEAKTVLIRICTVDNEPMVLQEAIRSLGTIGLNDNDDAVNAIVWVATKNLNSENPDNLLALAAVDTLDKLVAKYKTIDPGSVQLIARIMEGPYAPPVRERARQTLANMHRAAAAN